MDVFWFETAFLWFETALQLHKNNSILLIILFRKLEDSTACTLLLCVHVVVVLLSRKNTKTNFGVENPSLSQRV